MSQPWPPRHKIDGQLELHAKKACGLFNCKCASKLSSCHQTDGRLELTIATVSCDLPQTSKPNEGHVQVQKTIACRNCVMLQYTLRPHSSVRTAQNTISCENLPCRKRVMLQYTFRPHIKA